MFFFCKKRTKKTYAASRGDFVGARIEHSEARIKFFLITFSFKKK